MITNRLIFDTLLTEINDQQIKRAVIGFNWTLVETEFGCGLASTPKKRDDSCLSIPSAGSLTNLTTRDAARLVYSQNPIEVSIGLAAINSFYNKFSFVASKKNGLDFFTELEGPITTIGRFPGLSKRFKNIRIIEKNPREGEYGEKDSAK